MSSLASFNPQPFRFFDLPSELRSKILSFVVALNRTVDLEPLNNFDANQRLNLFLASQRLHSEASHIFYSEHTFRIFPTHWRFFGNKICPLLSRLPPRYHRALVTLELRLGTGWGNPPESWRVSDELGLEQMTAVRKMKIFIDCDPSHKTFKGFRRSRHFFTKFARNLLKEMISRLPVLEEVELDGEATVSSNGPLIMRLMKEAKLSDKRVIWGPQISSRSNS